MDLLISTGCGPIPTLPECYEAVLGCGYATRSCMHGLAAAMHINFAAVNSMTNYDTGVAVGLAPAMFGTSPGSICDLHQGIYEVTHSASFSGPLAKDNERELYHHVGFCKGTFANSVQAYMLVTETELNCQAYLNQLATHLPENSQCFKLNNCKFNIFGFPATCSEKSLLVESIKAKNVILKSLLTTVFQKPMRYPLMVAMKQDLAHIPALIAYSPVLLTPDYWDPQDNLYHFAFKATSKDKENRVASFYLQAPSNLLPPSVLLPLSTDLPVAPTMLTPVVSLPHIMDDALDWTSDSSDTTVCSAQSPAPKRPHSAGQASNASSSNDMDTDMEQYTLPFGNLASILDADNQDDDTAHTPFFEDSQEASSKLPSQQKHCHTTPSPCSLRDVPLPPSPLPDQQVDIFSPAAQQPAEAQEIQAVTLAFTQASCDDLQATSYRNSAGYL